MRYLRIALLLLGVHACTGLNTEEVEQRHHCDRKCVDGEPPRKCLYHFTVEWYLTMSDACHHCPNRMKDCSQEGCISADGFPRPAMLVNRQLPGPAIIVCQHDELTVEVENALPDEGVSIHWHGQLQNGTPYMDGAAFVTQCPIVPKQTFAYRFKADTPGTHFWHAHSILQHRDGIFGAFIVRQTFSEDNDTYDNLPEHIMLINGWSHTMSINNLVSYTFSNRALYPADSILINGKGTYVWSQNKSRSKGPIPTPRAEFNVERGQQYRFRIIIAGTLDLPLEISFDFHRVTVIRSDGYGLTPVEVESLIAYPGERFDVILNANQFRDVYWIRIRNFLDNFQPCTLHTEAILHYESSFTNTPLGVPNCDQPRPQGPKVDFNDPALRIKRLPGSQKLQSSFRGDVPALKMRPDYKLFLEYGKGNWKIVQVSKHSGNVELDANYTWVMIPPFTMMGDSYNDDQLESCDENCVNPTCECAHLIRVPLGSVYEIVLVNRESEDDAFQPFHMHGHAFRVVASGKLKRATIDSVQQMERQGILHKDLFYAPQKDTIIVPRRGYVVLRWAANNPGYWLFESPYQQYVSNGRSIVFKVGGEKDIPRLPYRFPQCDDYSVIEWPSPPTTEAVKVTPVIVKTEVPEEKDSEGTDRVITKTGVKELNKIVSGVKERAGVPKVTETAKTELTGTKVTEVTEKAEVVTVTETEKTELVDIKVIEGTEMAEVATVTETEITELTEITEAEGIEKVMTDETLPTVPNEVPKKITGKNKYFLLAWGILCIILASSHYICYIIIRNRNRRTQVDRPNT